MKYYKTEDVINCVADILAEEANKRGFKPQSPDYFKDKACGVLDDLPTIEVSEEQLSKLQASEKSVENTTASEDFTSISRANSKLEVSEDAISREWLFKNFQTVCENVICSECPFDNDNCRLADFIINAPSVIPNVDIRREGFKEGFNEGMLYERRFANRPKGEWIFKTIFPNDKSEFPMGYLVCSVCGSQHRNSTPCNYCDNCGSRMKGAQDE